MPAYKTGKICYIEIPAEDIETSAQFYASAFDWSIRQRGDGATAFDDTVGGVSGTWVTGRPAMTEPGLLVYVMVADARATSGRLESLGAEIVQPVDPAASEVFFTFRDPAGNVLGVYQQPGLAADEATGQP